MVKNKIKNWALNVDKLKVCFNISNELYSYFSKNQTRVDKINNTRCLDEENFSLIFFDEDETKMSAILNIKDSDGYFKLGTFIFNNGKKYKNLAFFSFENEALYSVYAKDTQGKSYNYISCLWYVIDYYEMTFNNVTTLELAFDSHFDFVTKIRKTIKNVDEYDLYLNGKKVNDNEILPGYGEYYSRNRLKLQLPTLYFSQAKKSDMQMRVYNKTREIEESTPYKKEIYAQWLKWKTRDTIYRVEIVFHNTNIRDFFNRFSDKLPKEMIEHTNILNLLNLDDFRKLMFFDATDRIIYFKHKKSKKT
jgi:hypothetical protein